MFQPLLSDALSGQDVQTIKSMWLKGQHAFSIADSTGLDVELVDELIRDKTSRGIWKWEQSPTGRVNHG